MSESTAKKHPSLAEFLLDRMGADHSGLRPSEANDLVLQIFDSMAEPPTDDSASQPPAAQPAAAAPEPQEPDFPADPDRPRPIFIADPQKVADFKRTLRARRSPRCRHRKVNGLRCGSPAMGSGSYCYFHFHIYTGDTQHLPVVEDGNSIAFIMGMIVRELASGRLEVPRANSMLYALQGTATLLKHLDFEPDSSLLELDDDDDDDDEPPDSAPLASPSDNRENH